VVAFLHVSAGSAQKGRRLPGGAPKAESAPDPVYQKVETTTVCSGAERPHPVNIGLLTILPMFFLLVQSLLYDAH